MIDTIRERVVDGLAKDIRTMRVSELSDIATLYSHLNLQMVAIGISEQLTPQTSGSMIIEAFRKSGRL